jgi:lambda repressor-like predicted transcriptional regulator
MMDNFKVTDMPALTTEAQAQLTQIESKYHSILSGHCVTSHLSDPNGALEKIRTFAIVFFDFYYSFYSQFLTHSEHWTDASETRATERIAVQLENFTATRNWIDPSIILTIRQTIRNHAKAKSPPPILRTMIAPPEFSAAALGIGENSPLLKVAKTMRLLNPEAMRRKSFVIPRLKEKGWSIADWAARAKVSRHTARDYLEANHKTTHTNRKLLAHALGVSFQEFPE